MPRRKVEEGLEAAKRLERHLEEIATSVVTKDTMKHVTNAAMELVSATNEAMKTIKIPQESKDRIHKAEKEMLLAIKSALDVVIAELDKEMPKKASSEAMQRIEIRGVTRGRRKA